jgi:hypothetical protein
MAEPGAANMAVGAEFLKTEVANQGLGDVAAPAPVEIPAAGVPRAGGVALAAELGALAKLPGTWVGDGFNLIARPDKQEGRDFFLELDKTRIRSNSRLSRGRSRTAAPSRTTSPSSASPTCNGSTTPSPTAACTSSRGSG